MAQATIPQHHHPCPADPITVPLLADPITVSPPPPPAPSLCLPPYQSHHCVPLAGPNAVIPHPCLSHHCVPPFWPHHCNPHPCQPTTWPSSASPIIVPLLLARSHTVAPTPGWCHHCEPSTISFSTYVLTHALLLWHCLPLKIFSISWRLRKVPPSQIPLSGNALLPPLNTNNTSAFFFFSKKNS